jgi:hypothetical protein
MKISELVEAIGTIGSTTDPMPSDGLPKTGNNPAPNTNKNTAQKQPTPFDAAQMAQLKSNLGSLKDPIKAAGGQDFDVGVLAKTLADPNAMAGNNVNPIAAKAIKAMMPALGAAEKNPQTASNLKNTFSSAAQAQKQKQQAAAQQQNSQTPITP